MKAAGTRGRTKENAQVAPGRSNRNSKLKLLLAVLLFETVDTTFSIHQLLLAREVRVASRADVDADFFLSRAGLECVAANARDVGVKEIIRVKVVFHICLRNLPTVIT